MNVIMGNGSSDSGGGSGGGGSWGQSSSNQSWGQSTPSGWSQTNAGQAGACNNAQSRADASCATAGSSDLSGRNGAGMDMVNQGLQCSRDQANADKVCRRQ